MRAFIAIEIPETAKRGMAAAQEPLRGAGAEANWSRPEGMHLTLKFLGEVGEDRVPEILAALGAALNAAPRFQIRLEGVGTFPNPKDARVVWVGIAGDLARLHPLQAAVENAAAGLGFAPEARPFVPHLTLGRVRRIRRRDAWLKALAGLKDFSLPAFGVTSVSLMLSELKPTGAVYREIGRVQLA